MTLKSSKCRSVQLGWGYMGWAGGVGGGRLSHLMAWHPAYEGSWGRPRQAHYLLQLVYV